MKRKIEDTFYPWWFIMGAFLYLQHIFVNWSGKKIQTATKDKDEQNRWRTYVRHFALFNLVCCGSNPVGFTLNNLRHLLNTLFDHTLEEVSSCLHSTGGTQYFSSNICKKVHNGLKSNHNPADGVDALFCTVVPQHNHQTWLEEPTCIFYQQGLKHLLVDRTECTQYNNLKIYFQDFNIPNDLSFNTMSAFSAWVCDAKQKKLWVIKPDSITMVQIYSFGQQQSGHLEKPIHVDAKKGKSIAKKRAPEGKKNNKATKMQKRQKNNFEKKEKKQHQQQKQQQQKQQEQEHRQPQHQQPQHQQPQHQQPQHQQPQHQHQHQQNRTR